MKKISLLLCTILLFHSTDVFSQSLPVSGRVLSNTGEPLSGATVKVKGTSAGVTTNADGIYSIAVPSAGSVLEVSYAGMQTQEVTVSRAGTQNFSMNLLPNSLSEVVVIGY